MSDIALQQQFYFSFLFLFFHTFLSARFLVDALIKLYETLQEYHMPCEAVLIRVDFFQNSCRCHGNGQNVKKIEKHKNDHSRLLAEQKWMKLDRNNIHIQWNEIRQKIGIGWKNFAAVAMETKKGDFNFFHQDS